MWYWMLGRLFSMTILGGMVALGLWLLGVPLPLALGFLAGIMIFVPYIGSVLSAVPSVLIAASTSLMLAVYVIPLFISVHLIEGYILVPIVQRRIVHLPPALTLSAQVILGFLPGFLAFFRHAAGCGGACHYTDGVYRERSWRQSERRARSSEIAAPTRAVAWSGTFSHSGNGLP
jgi:hypothetical protein